LRLAASARIIAMKKLTYKFSNSLTDYYFAYGFSHLKEILDRRNAVIVTDENVFNYHQKRFRNWNVVVLKPGEEYKVQATADGVIQQLIDMQADRKTILIGVGGGVITDITGYVASIYMRGIKFGFVPTTLLSMVDASIGGKNGIDVGVFKNLVGAIRQPSFILHDLIFLKTLPESEWVNGFAEIIKHACIKDAAMFRQLESNSLKKYQSAKTLVCELIQRNAILKTRVVQQDEFEGGDRRLLNFGHTLGHALENQYELSHGQAISIGMTYASIISEVLIGFKEAPRVARLLVQYGLPTFTEFDKQKVFNVLKMDKKRERKELNYVMLEKIGKGVVKSVPLNQLEKILEKL
jgi:3-dehydroquinate synthase